MTEIKTEIKQNADGSYTITDAHSTADVVRWLLTQDSKETILYLLGDAPQRTWVYLTNQEHEEIAIEWGCLSADWVFYAAAVERKVKEKNT
jgi:hypothetical protein